MARIVVPRQAEPYYCGPASLVTVGRLLGIALDEHALARELDAQPQVGTANAVLAAVAAQYLPVASAGPDTYAGGLAIWNVQNALSGVGHFVVVLGERGGRVRYYDPFWARVLEFRVEAVAFLSGDGAHVRWALNFETSSDWFEVKLQPEQAFDPEWALRSLGRWLDRHTARYDQ